MVMRKQNQQWPIQVGNSFIYHWKQNFFRALLLHKFPAFSRWTTTHDFITGESKVPRIERELHYFWHMTLDILVQFQNTLELGNLGRYNKRIFRTLHFGESESSTLAPRSCILEATQYTGDSSCWFSPLLCKITPRILKFNMLLFIHLFIQFLFREHFCWQGSIWSKDKSKNCS